MTCVAGAPPVLFVKLPTLNGGEYGVAGVLLGPTPVS